eukprot:PhM_4_TR11934/c0_g1_i1/m.75889
MMINEMLGWSKPTTTATTTTTTTKSSHQHRFYFDPSRVTTFVPHTDEISCVVAGHKKGTFVTADTSGTVCAARLSLEHGFDSVERCEPLFLGPRVAMRSARDVVVYEMSLDPDDEKFLIIVTRCYVLVCSLLFSDVTTSLDRSIMNVLIQVPFEKKGRLQEELMGDTYALWTGPQEFVCCQPSGPPLFGRVSTNNDASTVHIESAAWDCDNIVGQCTLALCSQRVVAVGCVNGDVVFLQLPLLSDDDDHSGFFVSHRVSGYDHLTIRGGFSRPCVQSIGFPRGHAPCPDHCNALGLWTCSTFHRSNAVVFIRGDVAHVVAECLAGSDWALQTPEDVIAKAATTTSAATTFHAWLPSGHRCVCVCHWGSNVKIAVASVVASDDVQLTHSLSFRDSQLMSLVPHPAADVFALGLCDNGFRIVRFLSGDSLSVSDAAHMNDEATSSCAFLGRHGDAVIVGGAIGGVHILSPHSPLPGIHHKVFTGRDAASGLADIDNVDESLWKSWAMKVRKVALRSSSQGGSSSNNSRG